METNFILATAILACVVVALALTVFFSYTPDNCGPICMAKAKKYRFKKFYNENDEQVFCIQFRYRLIWRSYCKYTYCPETFKTLEDAKKTLEKVIKEGQVRIAAKKKKPEYFEC